MKRLIEVGRETYGRDARAINRHSDRKYQDENGRFYLLSRTLDGVPPFFEAYGQYTAGHEGVLPRLKVNGMDYWGGGWNWQRAIQAFLRAIGATLSPKRKQERDAPARP